MTEISPINRLLDVPADDIVPKTAASVREDNKLSGTATLRTNDRSLVIGASNNETANPLWHD